jgi:hypothetical protein
MITSICGQNSVLHELSQDTRFKKPVVKSPKNR